MEIRADFLEWLGPDAAMHVFLSLDDPADIVRLTSVSPSWRRYVIFNGFCKKLCLRRCDGVSCFEFVVDITTDNMIVEEANSSSDREWAFLVKEHKVYSYLGRCLFTPLDSDIPLISETIRASSTDINFTESGPSGIENSRYGNDRSCWSSKGERDPKIPATLIYRLGSRLCFVNEIRLQPFQAKFQPGNPIYSAKAVRFRMGHSLLDPDEDRPYPLPQSKRYRSNPLYGSDKEFVWSYVSPEFPMAQRNELQSFKLPRPALCIGGFLQVELLGRVQVHPTDNLYRICICNVEAIGQPPSTFDVYIDLKSGGSVLQYYSEVSVSYEHHPDLNNHLLFDRVENIHFEKLYNNHDDDDDV